LAGGLNDPARGLPRLAVPGDGAGGVLPEDVHRPPGKPHRPRDVERGRLPPAASRGEAAQAAERLTEGDRGHDDVGEAEEVDLPRSAEPPYRQRRAYQPSVEDEPATQRAEQLRGAPARQCRQEVLRRDEDEEDLRP